MNEEYVIEPRPDVIERRDAVHIKGVPYTNLNDVVEI